MESYSWLVFGGFAALTEAHEAVKGAIELALESGFSAVEEINYARLAGGVGVGLVGAFGDGGGAVGGGAEGLVFPINAGGFDVLGAEQTPAGGDHHFEEGVLGGAFGFPFEEEAAGEGDEMVGVFAFEEDGFGEALIADVVAVGFEFAFGGFGAGGFFGIAAVCGDLFVCCHG
jgi:hypothetical protein